MFDYLHRQTFQFLEAVFVISSRSVDRSLEVASEMAEGDDRIRVVLYEDTGGLGGSKNLGLSEISGDYVWFLDADDSPSYRFLEEMVGIADRHDADVVGCNFVYSGDNSPFVDYPGVPGVVVMDSEQAVLARVKERFPVASWSMIYRTDMVRANGISFPKGLSEDIIFTYMSLKASRVVCYCTKPLYGYYLNPLSVCNDPARRDERGMSEVTRYEWLDEHLSDMDCYGEYRRRSATIRFESAGHMSYRGYMGYVESDRHLDCTVRGLGPRVYLEAAFQRLFPNSYYLAIRTFFRLFYYRPGRMYTRYGPSSGEVR